MTYRRSKARREFELQIEAAISELRPLYAFSRRSGGVSGPRLLAAYYVFAFAQLEVYIKSFVEDCIGAFNQLSPPIDRWPDTMVGYLIHKSENLGGEYRRFGISDDEGAILKKIAETARKVAKWSDRSSPVSPMQASEFLDRKKYPSPANLPQLFRRLGIRQIWAVVSAAGKTNGELLLTSLNDLRTGIAHEGKVPPGFAIADFQIRIDQMRKFVAALDRGVSGHFCSNAISRVAWNGVMT